MEDVDGSWPDTLRKDGKLEQWNKGMMERWNDVMMVQSDEVQDDLFEIIGL